jgi:hypothetical protein
MQYYSGRAIGLAILCHVEGMSITCLQVLLVESGRSHEFLVRVVALKWISKLKKQMEQKLHSESK